MGGSENPLDCLLLLEDRKKRSNGRKLCRDSRKQPDIQDLSGMGKAGHLNANEGVQRSDHPVLLELPLYRCTTSMKSDNLNHPIGYLLSRLVPGLSVPLLVLLLMLVSVVEVARASEFAENPAQALLPEPDSYCLSPRQLLAQLTGVMVPYEDFANLKVAAAKGELSLIGILGDPADTVRQSLTDQITDLQTSSPVPLLFGSDEESRSVQRLDKLIYKLPSTRQLLVSGPQVVEDIFRDYALEMRRLGFHITFGPVVDVGNGPGIKRRSFGIDNKVVADTSSAVIRGLAAGGIYSVLKHFPGHGSVNVDSHDDLPVTPALSEMQTQISVYRNLFERWADSVGVMVGHLNVPDLTSGKPASLSADAITLLLRRQLNFDGVVITDSLDMGAIARTSGQAAAGLQAILAGADIALVSRWSEQQKLLNKLEQALASGQLDWHRIRQSALRVLLLKDRLTGSSVAAAICGA